jgi:hypothetical protein
VDEILLCAVPQGVFQYRCKESVFCIFNRCDVLQVKEKQHKDRKHESTACQVSTSLTEWMTITTGNSL